ncbi:hypothetical protein DFJ58DRAFT_736749 [Suillus subalutaceus]|uniref:uncharacterized protein n=1 Tax=Suillus subalutaceus TaxID=48586 RepID=UPI001B85F92D|nr:uncharacterized protein DFJ58DRAFT_736749 [Suillus subalutaceus]KAG1831172.1 hypothetical protein DFJ58DRAFT_736749 [Suillus subalutaceus]
MSQGRKSAHGGAGQTEPRDQCVWTEADETILIEYVAKNHSQGGDDLNFDQTFWVAAAAEMEGPPLLGCGQRATIVSSESLPPFNVTQQPSLGSVNVSAPSSTASGVMAWYVIHTMTYTQQQ